MPVGAGVGKLIEDACKPKEHGPSTGFHDSCAPGHQFTLDFIECVIVGEGMENERQTVGSGGFCSLKTRLLSQIYEITFW